MVFLVCHSVKLIINGYEVYEMVKSNVDMSPAEAEFNENLPNNNFVPPIRVSMNETTPHLSIGNWVLYKKGSDNGDFYLKFIIKLHFMQLFSADATIFLKNWKKKILSPIKHKETAL